MILSIFRNNSEIGRVKPNPSSELVQKKQAEDYIQLNFELDEYLHLEIGDYISFEKTNQLYRLNSLPKIRNVQKKYSYECRFEGRLHNLYKSKVFLNTPANKTYKDYKFSLTGTAQTLLELIVSNLNEDGYDFEVGGAEETEPITFDFNNWNCYEALNEIAGTFNIEWSVQDNILSFLPPTAQHTELLIVGRLSGLRELERDNVDADKVYTVVYGFGEKKNIPPRPTYDSIQLHENRLMFGADSKLESNVDLYGRRTQVKEFEIFPHYTGTVTSKDSFNEIYDTGIDFDINNQLAEGLTPKIKFLTGQCIGMTFEIIYTTATGRIKLQPMTDESGEYPNETISPNVGDTYTIIDIIMPDSYINAAETRLQERTQQYLDEHDHHRHVYNAHLDNYYVRERGLVLDIGDLIRIVDNNFNIDKLYEVKELIQSITNPYDYRIKFGDILPISLQYRLRLSNFTLEQQIYKINRSTVENTSITNINETTWQRL